MPSTMELPDRQKRPAVAEAWVRESPAGKAPEVLLCPMDTEYMYSCQRQFHDCTKHSVRSICIRTPYGVYATGLPVLLSVCLS